ncbi:MAG: hypothetical protein CW716_03545 [Candidatus Bathyarchaeum sp.]|nr:MAG: hypothetical protein CW716_03545 [Candidatus Bathyarchaeum sp.]
MKIATSMLTVASVILWLVILVFSVTAVYSVLNVGVNIGEAQMLPTSSGIKFSLPFSINNDGYYEIADLNLTTRVTDPDGAVLDLTETFVESVPQGETVNASHTIEVALDEILSMDHLTLMLNDSNFTVEIFAGLSFARAVPVELSTNVSLPWGAPFADFQIGELSVSQHNSSHIEAAIPVSFENHAIIDITGTLKMEVYSSSDEHITSGVTNINVASQQNFGDSILLYARPQDASKLTGSGRVHILFETHLFTVDWWEHYG